MKINFFWRALLFPAIFLSGFFVFPTVASTYFEEIDQNYDFCGLKYNMNFTMRYGQSFVTQKNNVSSISMQLYAIGSDPNPMAELRLCRGTMTTPQWNDPAQDWDCEQPGQSLLGTTSALTQNGWTNFHFIEPVAVIPDEPLFFIIQSNKISTCGEKYNDYYPEGYARSGYNALDFSFKTFYDSDFQEMKRNPVILVPGIMGSYLYTKTPELVWIDPLDYLGPLDTKLDLLKMDEQGNSKVDIVAHDIIRSIYGNDFYGGLVDHLVLNGYEENKNLFVFPYDWRLDIDKVSGNNSICESTTTLKCLINSVKEKTSSDKVDIIAHSMGGLVVKDYVAKFGQDSIDKFIDIATPHLGAPKAAKILEYGDNMDIFVLSSSKMKEISYNIPSVYQLLPSQKYFEIPDNKYSYYLYNNSSVGSDNFQGELDYQQSLSYLVSRDNNITPFFVNKNSILHSQIDDVKIDNSYNIVGCGVPTIGKINNLSKKAFFWDKYGIEYIDGDGTVPLRSADYYGDEDRKYYLTGKTHSKVPGAQQVKDFIYLILNNQTDEYNFEESENFKNNDSICGIFGKVVEYHCPVDMHIYDEDGNHTGPTNNGDMENNILGVQYDIINGNKFVFLPAGNSYRVAGEAVGTGTLEVAVKTISNDQYTKTEYFNSIPLESTSFRSEINIVSYQDDIIAKIDIDNDGIFEEEISPDAVLTGDEINDLVKPETTINLVGEVGNNDFYVSDVNVELSAQDDNSGILKTEYSLDSCLTWTNYDNGFVISDNGTTTILYSSTDRAGNREENKEITIKIDNIAPEITMITPQAAQELNRNEILALEYLADDEFSGISTNSEKIYFDGQIINQKEFDLFDYSLGLHSVKIIISDLAGNISESEVGFYVVSNIESAISDIERLYLSGEIKKVKIKNNLIGDLNWIKNYIEKNAAREIRRGEVEERIMEKCVARKGQAWCDEKLGSIFEKINYHLSKIQQKIVKVKYNLILGKLELYKKLKWVSSTGYDIIKEDMKYLISKI